MMIAMTMMVSSVSLLIQVIALFKRREKQRKELFDADYVQRFFHAVGTYLDGRADSPYGDVSSYRAMAADIYRHIPSKHWMLVEKIDQAIAKNDTRAAWESLKLLSQSLAENGIEPIRSSVSGKNGIESSRSNVSGEKGVEPSRFNDSDEIYERQE